MTQQTQQMYILRVWTDNEQWRATLTDSVTLEKKHFSNPEALLKVITDVHQPFDLSWMDNPVRIE